MNSNLTDITVILDRSGSMASIKEDTEGGLNTFVDEQKAIPGEATFTLVQFDDEYEVVHKATPIRDVPKLSFTPRSSTALLDAIGRTIGETGARFSAIEESRRPGKVVIVILTDGHENASREFTRDKIFEMITHQREVYGWQFLFLGANQDAIAVGAGMGIPTASAMSFAPNEDGVKHSFAASARSVGQYRTSGAAPAYSTEDREAQKKAGVKT